MGTFYSPSVFLLCDRGRCKLVDHLVARKISIDTIDLMLALWFLILKPTCI